MRLSGLVLEQSKNALTVPLQAVTLGQRPTVVVLNRDHRLQKRAVTLGLQTPDKVEIRSGLADNELVLIGNRARNPVGSESRAVNSSTYPSSIDKPTASRFHYWLRMERPPFQEYGSAV